VPAFGRRHLDARARENESPGDRARLIFRARASACGAKRRP
jgi:hypothetical protein